MKLWLLGVLLGIALGATGEASAAVTGDTPHYADVASRFKVPLPDAYVHRADCPAYDFGGPCASNETHDVWLPDSSMTRFALAHELGHQFDEQNLNDGYRTWLRARMRAPGGVWLQDHGANEWFADFYALCALGYDRGVHRDSPEGYASHPSKRRLRPVCVAIRNWG